MDSPLRSMKFQMICGTNNDKGMGRIDYNVFSSQCDKKLCMVSDLQISSNKIPEGLYVKYRMCHLSPEEWAKSQPDTIERHGRTYKKIDRLYERTWSNRKVVDSSVLYTREIVETFTEHAVKYIIID